MGLVAVTLFGCASEPPERALSVDKRAHGTDGRLGRTRQAYYDSCGYLVGMNVCDPAYLDAMYRCGYESCREMGNSEEDSQWCGERMAEGAARDCDLVERERELCASGRADPASCVNIPPPGGGSPPPPPPPPPSGGGEEGCSWCDCYGEATEYHGYVCSTDQVSECWYSCW